MPTIITEPHATAMQISGAGPGLRQVMLVVLAKRTYALDPGRPCVPAAEQLPIRITPVFDAERDNLLVTDVETYPYKLLTDVVVRGHVYPGPDPTRVDAAVTVPPHQKVLSVQGDRRCARGVDGRVRFSDPEPFEKMPLEYDRAYGGWDRWTEARRGNRWSQLARYAQENTDVKAYDPYVYPRNRHGRGYLVEESPEAIDGLVLPNIEDPDDLLTPERLTAGHPHGWHSMPLPAGTTWVPPAYFCRGAFLGMYPFWKELPDALPEFGRALLPREVKEISLFKAHPLVLRYTNGASPGLQVPYLLPGATITLTHMHPKARRLTIQLPNDVPSLSVDGRNGKLVATKPEMHHVEIEPDEGRLSIVWRGAAPALRQYMPDELAKMPFRVEWRMG